MFVCAFWALTLLAEWHNAGQGEKGWLALFMAVAHHAAKAVFLAGVVATAWLGYRYIRQYNWRVQTYYADTEDKTIRISGTIRLLLLLTAAVSMVAAVLGRHAFCQSPWLLGMTSGLFSALLYALGLAGLRQSFSHANMVYEQMAASIHARQHTPAEETPLLEAILRLTDEERIYLTPIGPTESS